MLFAANVAFEQDVIAAAIMIALLIPHLRVSDVHQHSTFHRSSVKSNFQLYLRVRWNTWTLKYSVAPLEGTVKIEKCTNINHH